MTGDKAAWANALGKRGVALPHGNKNAPERVGAFLDVLVYTRLDALVSLTCPEACGIGRFARVRLGAAELVDFDEVLRLCWADPVLRPVLQDTYLRWNNDEIPDVLSHSTALAQVDDYFAQRLAPLLPHVRHFTHTPQRNFFFAVLAFEALPDAGRFLRQTYRIIAPKLSPVAAFFDARFYNDEGVCTEGDNGYPEPNQDFIREILAFYRIRKLLLLID